MNHPWFRFYSEALNDRKIGRICTISGQPKALVLGAWATLLCLANDSPERGILLIGRDLPITKGEIQTEMGLDGASFEAFMAAFADAGMITSEQNTIAICHWSDRQFDSDNSTERVKRYRQRLAGKDETPRNGDDETDVNVSETFHETVAETFLKRARSEQNRSETETETETETEPPNPPSPRRPGRRPALLDRLDPSRTYDAKVLALADVCGMNTNIPAHRQALDRSAAQLSEYTAAAIQQRYSRPAAGHVNGWCWYADDWRGQRGDQPTPEQVVETINKTRQAAVKPAAPSQGLKEIEPGVY